MYVVFLFPFFKLVFRLLLELSIHCLLSDSLLSHSCSLLHFQVDYCKLYTCSNVNLFWILNSARICPSLFKEDLLEYLPLLFLLFFFAIAFFRNEKIAIACKLAENNRKFYLFPSIISINRAKMLTIVNVEYFGEIVLDFSPSKVSSTKTIEYKWQIFLKIVVLRKMSVIVRIDSINMKTKYRIIVWPWRILHPK